MIQTTIFSIQPVKRRTASALAPITNGISSWRGKICLLRLNAIFCFCSLSASPIHAYSSSVGSHLEIATKHQNAWTSEGKLTQPDPVSLNLATAPGNLCNQLTSHPPDIARADWLAYACYRCTQSGCMTVYFYTPRVRCKRLAAIMLSR
jgi:hypothetical protein